MTYTDSGPCSEPQSVRRNRYRDTANKSLLTLISHVPLPKSKLIKAEALFKFLNNNRDDSEPCSEPESQCWEKSAKGHGK